MNHPLQSLFSFPQSSVSIHLFYLIAFYFILLFEFYLITLDYLVEAAVDPRPFFICFALIHLSFAIKTHFSKNNTLQFYLYLSSFRTAIFDLLKWNYFLCPFQNFFEKYGWKLQALLLAHEHYNCIDLHLIPKSLCLKMKNIFKDPEKGLY